MIEGLEREVPVGCDLFWFEVVSNKSLLGGRIWACRSSVAGLGIDTFPVDARAVSDSPGQGFKQV